VQNAKVLPCLHTFCLQCLKDLWNWKDESRGQQRVSCPVCRQAFKLPAAGPDALQSNFFLKSLLEVGRDEPGDGSSCDAHPDRRLDRYCLKCRVMICRKCQSVGHRKHDSEDVKAVAQRYFVFFYLRLRGIMPFV